MNNEVVNLFKKEREAVKEQIKKIDEVVLLIWGRVAKEYAMDELLLESSRKDQYVIRVNDVLSSVGIILTEEGNTALRQRLADEGFTWDLATDTWAIKRAKISGDLAEEQNINGL